jgi:hypothetical protein
MTEYESLIRTAEQEAAQGRHKEAYNLLGRAITISGPDDWLCRYRRGVYALQVAHTRLDRAEQSGLPDPTLVKAGNWLSRAEAYLMSAAEQGSADDRAEIEGHLLDVRREEERFRRLWRSTPVDGGRLA